MFTFTQDELKMLRNIVGMAQDAIFTYGDEYTDGDQAVVDKLATLANTKGNVMAITSDDLHNDACCDSKVARAAMSEVVEAELDNWVPDASQRLLFRAGAALGFPQPDPDAHHHRDCGDNRDRHALVSCWIAGLYLSRCATCLRLFR